MFLESLLVYGAAVYDMVVIGCYKGVLNMNMTAQSIEYIMLFAQYTHK